MNSRAIAPLIAGLAVVALAGCGSSDDSAATATSAVTVTRTVAPSAPVPTPVVTETVTSTADAPDTDTAVTVRSAPTVDRGTGASAYVGHYQRHESLMNLNADQTGDILEGANAIDGEKWTVTWRPAAQGITITYQRRLEQSGKGLEIGLRPGLTMAARFTRSENGAQILTTSSPGSTTLVDGWCGSGTGSGGAPECGA
ncbi:hypothetical protein ACQ7HM_03220 [Williamsia sp. MIQD14]|uniref:hypothetical protein n=1 Tax=Williamsia sp. MIQD14 TaxID=3425703 RepID=UPI003DA196CD